MSQTVATKRLPVEPKSVSWNPSPAELRAMGLPRHQLRRGSLDCPPGLDEENAVVSVRGWNVTERFAEIQRSAAPAPDN